MNLKNITRYFSVLLFMFALVVFVGCGEVVYELTLNGDANLEVKVEETVELPLQYTAGANLKVEINPSDLASYENGKLKGLKEGTAEVNVSLVEDATKTVEITLVVKAKDVSVGHTHEYDQEVVDVKYLAKEATCETKATYYKSCTCGETDKAQTFETGELAAHVYDQEVVDVKYLASEATTESPAKYYKSCVCGETDKGETFENGEKISKYTIVLDYGYDDKEEIITFVDKAEVELPTPTRDGYEFLGWFIGDNKVTELENQDYNLIANWQAVKVSMEIFTSDDKTEYYLDDEFYVYVKFTPASAAQDVTWRSLTATRGKVYEDGVVEIIKDGTLTIRATSADGELSAKINLTILDYYNPHRFLEEIHIPEVVAKTITAYDSNTGYKTYILGGITNYMFKDIDVKQNIIEEGRVNRPGTSANGNKFSARYVTVHDVGASGNALANTNYCATATNVSWHYTVGNDGIFQQLPLNEVGWHAGDGTSVPLEFTNTNIKAPNGNYDPAKVTINQTSGNFELNGIETTIKAPLKPNGQIVSNNELPYTGINNYVNEDGYYMLSNTHWDKTYQTLGNYGGNLNSIGIETCVNKGASLYLTWYLTAKLIATNILPRTGLKPVDVKQHNTFSGKDCPMTMRHANQWENFMKIVSFEYKAYSFFLTKGWTLELICDSEYVTGSGIVSSLPEIDTTIQYKVRLVNTKLGFDETVTYNTLLPAASNIVVNY